MSYSEENGYVPVDVATIMLSVMDNYNTQFGATYTAETFAGTNAYKYYYALVQRLQENEIKTSEIFTKLQQYFVITNEAISRPVVTNPGLLEALDDAGYVASVKPMIDADAGKINVCVDIEDGDHATGNFTITSYLNLVSGSHDTVSINGTAFTAQATAATLGTATFQAATSNAATAASLALQINSHATVSLSVIARAIGAICYITAVHGGTAGNAITLGYTDNDTNVGATKSGTVLAGGTASLTYATDKAAIAAIIRDSTAAGAVTQGLETTTLVLTNGQAFDFKFWLPERIRIYLKLTITLSENNTVVVGDPDDTKELLIDNIAANYKLGKNFEPQRYFAREDAPWAASVLLEWSYDNVTFVSTVYNSDFDELFETDLADVTLVEA